MRLKLLLVLLTISGIGVIHGIEPAYMDTSVRPGDDFFEYTNGGWLKKTQIPPDQSRWGSFTELREEASKRTAALIQEAAKSKPAAGSNGQKVGDYYASYMDEATIEKAGLAPLNPGLDSIDAIANPSDLARYLGLTVRADVDALNNTDFYTENILGLWTAPGFEDADQYLPYLLQGGLGMPDREYFISDNPKMVETRQAYQKHISEILRLAGIPDPNGKAARILELEHKIAQVHASRAESEDVHQANNLWSRDDFAKKAPGLEWAAFLEGANLSQQTSFNVWHPKAVIGIAALAKNTPLNVWKDYLTFHHINRLSEYLPKAFVQERFNFYDHTLSGIPQMKDRWKRAIDVTNAALGDAVGEIYAKHYFSPEAKSAAQSMVENIKAAFGKRIDALQWMSPETKSKAKEKLKTLYVGIGYPDKWTDYSTFQVIRGDAYGNRERAERFELKRQIARLGKKVDRTEWSMTPQTVNAVNLPLQNALNFPAAILEKPFFDGKADPVVNYGAIGSVIGHEISHSFDDQGSQFDANGRLANWWTEADLAKFKQESEKLAKQYDAYAPFPDLHVKGHQTLGENIADVAGLSSAFDGWVGSLHGKAAPKIGNFTAEQVFFISFGQSRHEKSRDEFLRQQILTDGHAPGRYRVYAVRNLDPWYAAFNVKQGDKLFLSPPGRVQVW